MQISLEKKKPYLIEMTLKESGATFEKEYHKVLKDVQKNGSVKGFKKGAEIPEKVIVREFGKEVLERQTLDNIIEKLYPKALAKEKIIPAAPGNITEVKSVNPVEVVFEVEIFPEVKIDEKKLDAIKIKKTSVRVTKKEVEEELDAIKTRFTHFHEAGKKADDGADTSNETIEKGDRATITAQGYDKKGGAPINETYVPSHPLVIGSGSFIPGFEDKLIGAKVGDKVDFDITFPDDYHSDDFKGRKVYFEATVEKIEKPHTPEFTEEFIEQLRGKKTDLEGFKEILKKEITDRKQAEARQKDEVTLMEKLEKITTLEIGPALIGRETDQVFLEHSEQIRQQGLDIKNYLEHVKMDEETYKKDVVRPEAERRLRAELILSEIRKIKKVEPTEKDMKAEIALIIEAYGSPEVIERLEKKLIPGDPTYEDVKNRLAYKQVVEMFFE
ncbi:trigger factor [Candidatus Gracilibacteria bacterium]|nr:trigger factor [Candidatus Gracilibacteria bacterium]MBS9783748.1 trigger factor [Candidatus Gracilibacteria bacterium]